MTIITIENVSQRFEQALVLDNISFKVNDGGRLVLLGASGSGKTSLLRIVAGIDAPIKGQVLYDDRSLEEIPHFERNIGMVFQNYALIPHWEAQRTIGFFLSLRQREREVPERVHRVSVITGIGLDKLMNRKPNSLSGGEKQQVAIARAFARDLSVLLLDEPFANLDAKLRMTARVELQKLMGEFPVTTLMVTHDQTEAAAISDGIILLRDGKIEQFGEYDHLRNNPDTLYVAQFMGLTPNNVFQGTVRNQQWQGRYFGGFPIKAPRADHTALTMTARPESIALRVGGVPAKITHITPYYSQKMQLLEVAHEDEAWQIEVAGDSLYHVNETVECVINPNEVLFFDDQTGRRVL